MEQGGEFVLAGSVPGHSTHPFGEFHRRSVLSFFIGSTLSLLLIWQILTFISELLAWATLIPAVILGWTWSGYRRKRSFAVTWVQILCGFMIAGFATLGIISFIQGILGSFSGVIYGGLLIWLAMSQLKTTALLKHELFLAWYHDEGVPWFGDTNLKDGEMLAACPHCASILAIKPEMLSPADSCPNCEKPLVLSKGTAKDIGEEE